MSRARDIANLLSTDSPLIDNAPDALNTLNELAAALGDDENFATTVTNSLAGKAPLADVQEIQGQLGGGQPITVSSDTFLYAQRDTFFATYLARHSDTNSGINLIFRKARGTIASPAAPQSGDRIGNLNFQGYSAAADDFVAAAMVQGAIDDTPDSAGDSSDMPGRLEFSTTPNGSSTLAERMRINNAGAVLIGTTTPGSAGAGDLVVNGGVFLGGTAAGNELDDYETGTWTPELALASSITYNSQIGTYTKIGRLVYVSAEIDVASHTQPDGSGVNIQGLPFTGSNSGPDAALFTVGSPSFFLNSNAPGIVQFGGNNFILREIDGSAITYTDCAASGKLTFSAMYEVL